ncbi:hypothetical protein [Candidatus Absconditicoccus praedator]|uniref:hypothetical protein n=1 Tax=Candidatus Absconditicoccus praedator TaxID=2735562 RepID=UPI001E3AB07A|nr:hypothetical protein [Candidatus Absconditicoccus praedator]UFX83067.1 hypothetical protein HLG78_02935 [Candidatus Absconditicoccus praedator]
MELSIFELFAVVFLLLLFLFVAAKVMALCLEVFLRAKCEAKKEHLPGDLERQLMRVEFDENGRVESFGIKRRPRQY